MSPSLYQAFDTTPYHPPASPQRPGDERHAFQRDRDRVTFSFAFRRLQSKTQVFQSGQYDFYRTRLTHSIEVARIARSIGEMLRERQPELAIDSDLLEAIGLAHDLGHPPFGHIGERKLNQLMVNWGGFEGNAQTVRILTHLFWERREGPRGMGPSRAFLDGVMKYKALHSEFAAPPDHHFLYQDQAEVREFVAGGNWPSDLSPQEANRWKSLECQIMDWADDTAYSLHDIVDGVRAGYLSRSRIEAWASGLTGERASLAKAPALPDLLDLIGKDYLEASFARRVGEFIRACQLQPSPNNPLARLTSRHAWRLEIDPEVQAACQLYKTVALDLVFRSPSIQQAEFKSGYLLGRLFEAFFQHYPPDGSQTPTPSLELLPPPYAQWVRREEDPMVRARLLCDHLAQLTDHEAIRLYRRLFDPDYGSISELV